MLKNFWVHHKNKFTQYIENYPYETLYVVDMWGKERGWMIFK